MSRSGKVGVVTVTYNSVPVLNGFLESLTVQTYNNFILYAVDNASKDASVAQLQAWGDPRLRIIANAENVGVAEGNNQGTRAALADDCEYVLYLNNDVEFQSNTFATLVSELNVLQCEMVAPKIMFADGIHIWSAGGGFKPIKGYNNFHIGEGEVDRGQFETPKLVQHAPTCCLLVRDVVFERIGIFDPKYFVYWDDTEFTFRAWRAGIKLFYTPRASILHKVSSLTGGSTSVFTTRYNVRGHIYFMLKNLGLLRCLYYLPAWELHLLYKLLSRSISGSDFLVSQKAFFEGIRVWVS